MLFPLDKNQLTIYFIILFPSMNGKRKVDDFVKYFGTLQRKSSVVHAKENEPPYRPYLTINWTLIYLMHPSCWGFPPSTHAALTYKYVEANFRKNTGRKNFRFPLNNKFQLVCYFTTSIYLFIFSRGNSPSILKKSSINRWRGKATKWKIHARWKLFENSWKTQSRRRRYINQSLQK